MFCEYTEYCVIDKWKIYSYRVFGLKTIRLRYCLIVLPLIIKKLVAFQGHCELKCFVSTEYYALDRSKIFSVLKILFKDNSFKVLSIVDMALIIIKKLVVLQGHC